MTVTLHHGDCLDVMRGLPDQSVTHVITDPPYEAEAHTKARRQRTGGVVEELPIGFSQIDEPTRNAAGAEFTRLATRWAIVFCQIEAAMTWRRTMEPAMRYARTCIWVKPDGSPQFTGDRPGMGYESFVCMYAGKARWNGGGRRGVFDHNVGRGNDHPTTKPLALMLEIIELFTDPDDVVLDPFAGSGTTGVACLRLGRRFIGIEREEKYYRLARERLDAEAQNSTLAAYRAKQEPLFR